MEFKYPVSRSSGTQRYIFERLHVGFWSRLPGLPALSRRAEFRLNQVGNAIDGTVGMLSTWLLDGHRTDVREESEEFLVPVTWWDHWKQDCAPGWFLKRWPAKTRSVYPVVAVHHHYVCPHVDPDERKHYEWMGEMSGQKR